MAVVREARAADLAEIIALFAEDTVGGHGDTTDPAAMPAYRSAFDAIAASPSDTLYVAEIDNHVVGTFQTTLIVTLTGRGSSSLKVSAVQTRADLRGRGIGAAMMRFAIEEARSAGAASVQLVSNAARSGAHRFYQRLGFVRSHVGFKLML